MLCPLAVYRASNMLQVPVMGFFRSYLQGEF